MSKSKLKPITDEEKKRIIFKVAIITIAVNILLTVFKLFAGIFDNSMALVSDAIHSGSDVLTTVIVMIGAVITARKSDDSHRYGHERMESVASILLAGLLFATGIMIGYNGVSSLITKAYKEITLPSFLALSAAIASIVVKEWMYWYTIIKARKINSSSLKADAWHHRSDAFSSIGSAAGIAGVLIFKNGIFDVIAGLIICIFIVKVSVDIFRDAINKLVDKSCDAQTITALEECVKSIDEVEKIDDIKTRMFGDKIYVDIEISADANLNLKQAHDIAEKVHFKIEDEFDSVKHCMVHVNPVEDCEECGKE